MHQYVIPSASQRIGNPRNIHVCPVCDLHVADRRPPAFYDGVLKQVQHDGFVYRA